MANQTLLGRFALSAYNFTIDATQKTTTAGNYYLCGYSGESTKQLCEHLQTLIRTVSGKGSATVTFSHSTGKITIDFGATTSVTWDDTALRDLLGWTGDLSGSSSYTAPNKARYQWIPSRSCSSFPTTLAGNSTLARESTTVVYRSKNGFTYSVVGNMLYSGKLAWDYLEESEVLLPSTGTVYGDLETFWTDVIHAGQPIRVLPDNSSYTSTSYRECICIGSGDVIGSFTDIVGRNVKNYQGLWSVQLNLYEFNE